MDLVAIPNLQLHVIAPLAFALRKAGALASVRATRSSGPAPGIGERSLFVWAKVPTILAAAMRQEAIER